VGTSINCNQHNRSNEQITYPGVSCGNGLPVCKYHPPSVPRTRAEKNISLFEVVDTAVIKTLLVLRLCALYQNKKSSTYSLFFPPSIASGVLMMNNPISRNSFVDSNCRYVTYHCILVMFQIRCIFSGVDSTYQQTDLSGVFLGCKLLMGIGIEHDIRLHPHRTESRTIHILTGPHPRMSPTQNEPTPPLSISNYSLVRTPLSFHKKKNPHPN